MKRLPIEDLVLEHIKPKQEEYDHIWSVAGRLIEAVNESGIAHGMVVGSVARDTWVRGDRDLDIFMLFNSALTREELEEQGLSLARTIASQYGEGMTEKYAEHPYINTSIEDLDIDLVPCYAIEDSSRIQSAVDRTPFHTVYIREHINGYIDDVLLLKQFMKTSGIYGSDQMTEGFAGYLCELLVINYGGFSPLLEAAGVWRPGTVIDIEGHQKKEFDDPLVVIDPVDPKRNVAASLSLSRMYEFVELSRGYLENPGIDFFFPPKLSHIDRDEFRRIFEIRGTHLYALLFSAPDRVPDVLVPQLRKSLEAIVDMLNRYGFVVNRADCATSGKNCMLLFELLVDELPPVKKHMGPQIWDRIHADKFLDKYVEGIFLGPYIEDGRYYVEKARKHTCVKDLLSSQSPLKVALGKHVKQEMENGWQLLTGDEVLVDEFIPFLSDFFQKRSPLMRIRHEQAKRKDNID